MDETLERLGLHTGSKGGANVKQYKRVGNRKVFLASEELDVDMLGEKGSTIVMRDRKVSGENVRQLPVEEFHAEGIDLKAVLESEEKDQTMEDVLDNLEALRPSDRIVSQAEFDTLQRVLVNGFTNVQMKTYLARANEKPRKIHEESKWEYNWVEKYVPWYPVRQIELVGSPKERLAITLMKEVWQLVIREFVDGQGTFSAIAEPTLLSMLTRDNARLAAIREAYLDQGERLEIANKKLTVVATKAKTETILQKIDEVAQDMITKEVKVDGMPRSDSYAALLEYLGSLTNTVVTYSRLTKWKARVTWIKDGPLEEDGREQKHTIIRRLLHEVFEPRVASVTLTYDPKATSGGLIPEVRGREKLAWMDKLTRWSRWVEPASRLPTPDSDFTLKADEVLPSSLEAPPQESETVWSKPYISTTASFGHILHKHRDEFSLSEAAKVKDHIFSPSAPPPTALAALSKSITSSKPSTSTLVLNFRAFQQKENAEHPGLLELHLTLPDDVPEGSLSWDACPKRLVAVMEQRYVDVAYPYEPIDLRLSQPLLATMSSPELDRSPFREYIETAKLDLMAGNLHPPPEITLSDLPTRDGSGPLRKKTNYLFAGLEIRRTTEVSYNSHNLRYTSVEAGLHGGRRGELVLEALPAESSLSDGEKVAHTESFLGLVQDFVSGRAVSWVGERVGKTEEVAAEELLQEASPGASKEEAVVEEAVEEDVSKEEDAKGSVQDSEVDTPVGKL
ncbi:hypothetical protein CCHL11_07715 [Colletotrichum chlorophyti]|uniref:Uncharacterized protein n=1 Tax=Colletotrichum chlorophyti TaxID=708187 RepID=A0A1Q8S7A1_9PEZI|nr:hypothetical protein CCHL11_07715 [Colletotrichum chlorophyti]